MENMHISIYQIENTNKINNLKFFVFKHNSTMQTGNLNLLSNGGRCRKVSNGYLYSPQRKKRSLVRQKATEIEDSEEVS